MLDLGYDGVQCGTRFIATHECTASEPYKTAILEAAEEDITLTERISGVPVAVIRTPYLEAAGTEVGRFGRWMLKGGRRKRWMRTFYGLRAARALNRSAKDPEGGRPLWQAGRSVGGIRSIMSTAEVVNSFARAVDPNAR